MTANERYSDLNRSENSLARDSAITIARFRPSKFGTVVPETETVKQLLMGSFLAWLPLQSLAVQK